MKKFEEEYDKFHKENHNMHKTATEYHKALKRHFKDVMFLEDYQSVKDRLKECEDLRIEANNKAAKEYTLKCEVVEERAELKREIDQLKSQLEKQQPEIPQFVAEFIKKYKGNWSLVGAFKNILENRVNNETLYNWVFAHAGKQELFAQAWLNGYTVAKEKRFYLKHELTGQFLAKRNQKSEHQKYFFWTGENPLTHSIGTAWELKFTQQEIDSMETGSYEQIEVEK